MKSPVSSGEHRMIKNNRRQYCRKTDQHLLEFCTCVIRYKRLNVAFARDYPKTKKKAEHSQRTDCLGTSRPRPQTAGKFENAALLDR